MADHDSPWDQEKRQSHAEREGREAYVNGEPLSHCPYPIGSQEVIEWEKGWRDEEAGMG